MTQAEEKIVNPPDSELQELCAELKRLSAASGSEARADREYPDGSVLTVTSREGADCELTVLAPGQPVVGEVT